MTAHLRRSLYLVLISAVTSTLVSCCGLKHQPLTVDEINERPPQRRAAITLSDPQIYSRETLINDRRQEAKYLQKLLEDSETAVFEPQIRRDLRTLTSTVLQLQAAYDPLSGRQAAKEEGLAEIDTRIAETEKLKDLAEARIKLIEAQRRLEELAEEQEQIARIAATTEDDGEDDDGGDGDDGGDDGGGDDGGDDGGTGGDEEPKQEDLDEEVEVLRAEVEELKKLLDLLPSTAEVRQTAVGATPREVFRDRQAYRGELRGALAEVELDDAHDQGQNSLYRLQFRATVLPGQHQDKMGVARLTLRPPELDRDNVLELYKTWLGHVTYRLNQTVGDKLRHDTSYLLLGMGLDRSLFHSTDLPVGDERIFVALPPKIYAKWKRVTRRDPGNLQCRLAQIRHKKLGDPLKKSENLCSEDDPTKDVSDEELLQELSYIEPFMSASIRGLSDIDSIRPEVSKEIHGLIEMIVDASDTLDRYRHQLESACRCGAHLRLGSSEEPQYCMIPKSFLEALVHFSDSSEKECAAPDTGPRCECPGEAESLQPLGLARGGADVYATAPVEVAQQVSTTMSAFRSFETALSLAAALPTQGLGGNLGFNRLRATRSDLEARERLPQVVGFAERDIWTTEDGENEEDPQFGWIFGPQATIDAQWTRLRLRRPVVNLPVTAGLSIPGWWPKVELELETAWVANWHNGEILEPSGEKPRGFPVYLPLNRADLDGLTEYLAKKTVGGALAYTSIAAVSPDRITTCADEVTFLVYGANLWRSSDAYLNGLKASDIRVLPDMGGLSVTFEGIRDGLPQIPGTDGEAILTVWTRNGASSRKVTVLDPKKAGIACGAPKPQSLKLGVQVEEGSAKPFEISIANPTPEKLASAKNKAEDERRLRLKLKVRKDGKKDAALPELTGEVKLGGGDG